MEVGLKIGAHPLLVAFAFGLLGPAALAEDEGGGALDASSPSPSPRRATSRLADAPAPVLPEPDPLDVAAVEAAWMALLK